MLRLLRYSLFSIFLCLGSTSLNGQEYGRYSFTQEYYFNDDGLLGQSETKPFDTVRSGHFSWGMRTLVEHDGVFYQVYMPVVDEVNGIYIKKSSDGINWSNRIKVSDDTTGAYQGYAAIAVGSTGGNQTDICVIWRDDRGDQSQLRASVSLDGGNTFKPSVQVSDHTNSTDITASVARDSLGAYYISWNRRTSSGNYYTTWFAKSTDFGNSWSPKQEIHTGRVYSYVTQIVARGDGEVLVMICDDQSFKTNLITFRTTNAGQNWSSASPASNYSLSSEGTRFFTLIYDKNNQQLNLLHAYAYNSTFQQIRYNHSSDWSNSWSEFVTVSDSSFDLLQSASSITNTPSVAVTSAGNIYTVWSDKRLDPAGDKYNLYFTRSLDNGQTWDTEIELAGESAADDKNYPSIAVKSGATGDTVLFVWTEVLPVTLLEKHIVQSISNFKLGQNYPNPFNPKTQINYELNRKSDVTLSVFDISGKEIQTLVKRSQDIGEYSVSFDGQNLPSGVYFYTLKTKEFYKTRKMILLK